MQLVKQRVCLLLADAFGMVLAVREIAGLGVVGEDQVSYSDHLQHALDGGRRHAIVQFSFVAHDRVYEYRRAVGCLLLAVCRDDLGLSLRSDEARGDGIEAKAQLLPNWKNALDVVGGVKNVELAIVQRIAYQSGRQVIGGEPHIRKDGKHGCRGHLAIACHVVDQKYLFLVHIIDEIQCKGSKNYKDRKVKAAKSSMEMINDEGCRLNAND